MAKRNWLDKQLDHASSVVRSWSGWKRDMIRSQIGVDRLTPLDIDVSVDLTELPTVTDQERAAVERYFGSVPATNTLIARLFPRLGTSSGLGEDSEDA